MYNNEDCLLSTGSLYCNISSDNLKTTVPEDVRFLFSFRFFDPRAFYREQVFQLLLQ
jgi:hypothetical protein